MENEKKRSKVIETGLWIVGGVLLALFLVNTITIYGLAKQGKTYSATGGPSIVLGDFRVLPTGIPEIYGSELGISYDDVSVSTPQKADATIAAMSQYDKTITLTGSDLDRYISVVSQISCEYCCGAGSVIRSDGSSACGCSHSSAMRGLAKYLITEHGNEFSNDRILEELGKWKTLFYPDIMQQKAQIMYDQGIEMNHITLASNMYRGIETGSSGGSMVGGC